MSHEEEVLSAPVFGEPFVVECLEYILTFAGPSTRKRSRQRLRRAASGRFKRAGNRRDGCERVVQGQREDGEPA